MADKTLISFIIIIFIVLTSYFIVEYAIEPPTPFQVSSNGSLVLFSAKIDHMVKIIITVRNISGSVTLHFNDYDVISFAPLHLGVNTFSYTSNNYTITCSPGSSIVGTFLIQDSGPDLGLGLFFEIPFIFLLIFIIYFMVSFHFKNDFSKFLTFVVCFFNLFLIFTLPSYFFFFLSPSDVVFGPLPVTPYIYFLLLVVVNGFFFINKLYKQDFSKVKSFLNYYQLLGFLSIVYGLLILSNAIPPQIFVRLNINLLITGLSCLYFLIFGIKLVSTSLTIQNED